MNREEVLAQYMELLDGYIELCDSIMIVEESKFQALLKNDFPQVERLLQTEQASVMRLQKQEAERMALQEDLGYGNITAGRMVEDDETLSRGERTVLRGRLRRLKVMAENIKAQNRSTMEYADSTLRLINTLLQTDSAQKASGVYQPPEQRKNADAWNPSMEIVV